jgi:hypothetical protein
VIVLNVLDLNVVIKNKKKMMIILPNMISDDFKIKHYTVMLLMVHPVFYIDQKLKILNKPMKFYSVLFKKPSVIKHEVFFVVQLMKF